MDEYIKRDDALMAISYYPIENPEPGDIIQAVLETACKEIAKINAADVAPVVYARWKYFQKKNIAVCTNCSFERNLDDNFGRAVSCPNCGAIMDGGV